MTAYSEVTSCPTTRNWLTPSGDKYLQMSFGSCFFGAVAWFLVSHGQTGSNFFKLALMGLRTTQGDEKRLRSPSSAIALNGSAVLPFAIPSS
jgi:hypothetical protein